MASRVLAFAGVVSLAFLSAAQPLAQTPPPFGQGAVRPGNGVAPPSVIQQIQPRYTDEARRQLISGDVELEAVVKADGTVGDVRVIKSLDAGLDQNAIAAAKQWVFKPATDRDGHAVPVIVTIILSFKVSDSFLAGVCLSPSAIVEPTLERSVEPKYTSDAMRAKIQGTVTVEAVVNLNGTVARARVVDSLDKVYGLDDHALAAAKQFTFTLRSGTCDGQPAPIVVILTLSFRLH